MYRAEAFHKLWSPRTYEVGKYIACLDSAKTQTDEFLEGQDISKPWQDTVYTVERVRHA